MIIDDIFKTGMRFAHFGARIGIEAAQAGLDLAKAAVDMLDPDRTTGAPRQDRISNLLGALESLAGVVGADRPLGAALRPGGAVDRLFSKGGLIDLIATENGVNNLLKDAISSELSQLDHTIGDLREVAEHLSAAATPLGRVAARVPKFLRKPLPYEVPPNPGVVPAPAADREAATEISPQLAQLLDDGHALVSPSVLRTNGNGHTNGTRS